MGTNADPAFGDLLRTFRDRAGLTQQELAERAELSVDAIGLLERGARQRPQRHTLQQLAAALGLADAERSRLASAARRGERPARAMSPPALPLPATTFVGRAAEVAALTRRLGSSPQRLVTLTGPGGVGKTRLALEVATRLADRFADGVAFVQLSPLREPDLVPQVIARALGVAERSDGTALRALTAALHARRLLLVLDNCEHLLSAAPLVAELLAACPRVVVLATSRAPLHLSAEQQYLVAPLDVAEPTSDAGWEALARQPAVALFTQRAAAAAPGFVLTSDIARDVTAICRRLDGLPLAIELAAAWVKVLPPHALLARLDRALPLLTGGSRDLPARQRTLRETIAWSADLLSPDERTLLHCLAVFAGGWTLPDAEAVGAVDGESAAVLPRLAALIDASLVQAPTSTTDVVGEPRYTLLETVREYAGELLRASGQEESVNRRHAAAMLALVEEAQPHLVGPVEGAWMERLEEEGDNLRAALRWALERSESDVAERFAAVLWRLWATRGHLSEGRRWLEAVLTLTAADGKTAGSAEPIAPLRRAMLQHVTGNLARVQGDYARAEALYGECLEIRRAHDDRPGISGALINLGITANEQGDHARAIRLYEEALPLAREVGNPYGIAFGLTAYGEAVQASGHPTRAAALFEEGLDWFRRIDHTWGIALASTRLGDAVLGHGDRVRAAALHREALALSGGLGDPRSAVDALEGLAHAEAGTDAALAAHLLGAAAALRDRLGTPRPPSRRTDHQRAVAATRAALGDADYVSTYAEGEVLTFEQALAVARHVTLGDTSGTR